MKLVRAPGKRKCQREGAQRPGGLQGGANSLMVMRSAQFTHKQRTEIGVCQRAIEDIASLC